jgi:signal peptidase I
VGALLRVAVGCALGALFIHTWLVAGLFQAVIVASGSMAPALDGPHRLWTCGACGEAFTCGLESLPQAGRPAVCPYCQSPNDAGAGVDRRGSRVIVDRSAYYWRAPRRWECVVLNGPRQEHAWSVKRIVGLPGERVEIREGEVWIDGQIARKTLAQTRQTAVRVHAARAPANAHWDLDGGWQTEHDRYVHPADTTSAPQGERAIQWLEYHHPARSRTAGARDRGPILDESPCNQAESRLLNPVSDVLVTCRVACGRSGALLVRGSSGGRRFVVRLDLDANEVTLRRDQLVVASKRAIDLGRGPFQLDWMLADGQAQLAIDGQLVVECVSPSNGAPPDGWPGLAFGAEGADVSLSRLQVLRDVYYTPGPPGSNHEYVLGPDEYFLLGDNSPHSEDSRWWPRSGVAAEHLIGRALRW